MSDSLWAHGLQHTRLPCPSPSPEASSNSCPLSWWCHPTISSSGTPYSSCLLSSSIRVFSNKSIPRIRWPKYWSFSIRIRPSNEYSGLTCSKIDWFDLLAVQGTLKSLLHHDSLKASIFWHSVFFMDQLWHPYMIAQKTIALTIWTFVSKVQCLCVLIHRRSQNSKYQFIWEPWETVRSSGNLKFQFPILPYILCFLEHIFFLWCP